MSYKLSSEDQALLNTDFGEDMEKEAAARVAACQNAYAYGSEKLAAEAADEMDKEENEDKEDKKEKMDEESEKAAAELGAFIERGFFDGLRKLGSERHNDEMHYITPYIMEKAAAMSMADVGQKIKGIASAVGGKARSVAKEMDPRIGLRQLAEGGREVAHGVTGKRVYSKGTPAEMVSKVEGAKQRAQAALGGLKYIGKGTARLSPYAAAAGGAGYGIHKAVSDKKD